MRRVMIGLCALGLSLLIHPVGAGAAPAAAGKTLRVYHIGNSVTDMINYPALKKLAASRGNTYVYGRHMMPGTPLFGLWDNQDKGFTEQPYGPSRKALADFQWDVITLQPFDRLLEGNREHEFESCSRFIDVALNKSPGVQFYIYQRWPKRVAVPGSTPEAYQPFDYQARWNATYTGNWDTTIETHDFFQRLVEKLNKSYGERLQHKVQVVPVGDVMAELDRRVKAGEVTALKRIDDLYVDTVHLNDAGRYLVGVTFYATLFGDDPIGLPSEPYGKIDPALAKAIQESVAKVVRISAAAADVR